VYGGKHTIECLRLGDFKFTKVTLRNYVWIVLRSSATINWNLNLWSTTFWKYWAVDHLARKLCVRIGTAENMSIDSLKAYYGLWSVGDAQMTYCSMTSGKVLKGQPKFEKCRHSIAVQDWLASFLLHHKKPKQIPWRFTVLAFCPLGFSHKMSYFFLLWKDLLFGQKQSTIEGAIKKFRSFKATFIVDIKLRKCTCKLI